jgi:hypothetical protein
MKKDHGLNDLERIERLERLLADLAEEVGTGKAMSTRLASQNVALAVLRELRPEPVTAKAALGSGAICGKPQRKGDEDSPVCLRPAGHKDGQQYGVKPA